MYASRKSAEYRVFQGFNYVLLTFLSVLFVYPFWNTLVVSLSSPETANSLGLKLVPDGLHFDSYRQVFESNLVLVGYMNTLIRVAGGTVLTIFVTYFAAYALSKRELPFRNTITLFVLFTMFFSGGLIPMYLNINELGLMGSRWALILPLATNAWNIIIARNFIMSLPMELEEAAYVDGANPFRMVFSVMLPLSAPILVVLALWTAVAHWNAWFDALIYIRDKDKMVLQLVLRRILIENSDENMKQLFTSPLKRPITPESVKAATIIVSIVPILFSYPFLQKYLVKGMLIGSLKG